MQNTNIENFVNPEKTGTVILSYYRSGSHFLHNIIMDSISNGVSLHEIEQVSTLTENQHTPGYKVGILHSIHPKFYLLDSNVLNHWHVVLLTRQDKINHFISTYFWKLNTQNKLRKFKHHNTENKFYKDYINSHQKIEYDIEHVKCWLLEQLLSYQFKYDFQIEYNNLKYLKSPNVSWKNNDYNEISLESLFTNYKEIEELLKGFSITY